MLEQDRLGVRVLAGVLVVFGVLTAAAAHPLGAAPTAFLIDMFYWPLDGGPGFAGDPGARLLAGVGGGMMVGWGATLWRLAGGASPAAAILSGALAWFVLDTIAAVLAQAWMRIPSNLSLLLAFYLSLRPALRRAAAP